VSKAWVADMTLILAVGAMLTTVSDIVLPDIGIILRKVK
jgi:hypothetical protein